ncbi:unnamed protein product [Gongylonema pulchrum]|uniref:NTF2 domain-containing protein n=1 Tax=Gongylonema pulchrum TaxID=637853 RepID=A0A183D1L1_9BILA|nr:unnamed protein product [Gongylonema pulchrum]
MLVAQASDAQHDITELYAPYLRHYFTGRQNLTLYDPKAGYKWKQCVSDPSFSSSPFPEMTPKQTVASAALLRQRLITLLNVVLVVMVLNYELL